MAKQLVLSITEGGCLVPISHKLNKDGYFRKMIGPSTWVMYHRYVWEEANGPIPDGFEVDHLCKNRACCNLEHLQCIHGSDHAVKTNKGRYLVRKSEMIEYYKATNCTGTELASKFGVAISTGCRLIKALN